MSIKALERHLIPFAPFLKMDGVTEICINKPQEMFVEKAGKFTCYLIPELEYGYLETLAGLIAEYNHKDFPVPLLSGSLPGGERIQLVMPPACEKDKLICSIRKHQMRNMTLNDYEYAGVFDKLKVNQSWSDDDERMLEQYNDGNFYNFLHIAIQARKNILISGGTGTGKTTFLNACLTSIPKHERLITVEDTREVNIWQQPNAVHLLFNEDDERITASKLFKVCLRLRPDRIFLSELRGAEVWPYLRAANSGHPGSLSTVHADTPESAFTQLVFMMQQAGSTSSEEQIRKYLKSIIHVVIQLKRDPDSDQFMEISDIWFGDNGR